MAEPAGSVQPFSDPMDTLISTWVIMGVLVIVALFVRLTLRKKNPGRVQQLIEAILDWMGGEVRNIIGRDPAPFLPLIASLFIFILASNMSSFVSPLFPGLKPPTSDIRMTAALAGIVFLAVPFYGIMFTGTLNYLKTYVKPVFIMLPFNIISDISRTVALAVRLFGNILSGEILMGVILALLPFLLPLPLMFLSLITGAIQAYIFTVLAIVYIGGAVRVVEKHEKEESPT